MDKTTDYISIAHLFKAYKYFQHHLIIKNLFTPSICEWFYSYNKIELNPLLLFSIPHILNLTNKNYNIDYYVNYEVQDIKIISNKPVTEYSSFLKKYDFKLVIPLSNCSIVLNNELVIDVNCGEVMVITADRSFVIEDDVDIISIDITGSFDVINLKGKAKPDWWLKHLPNMESECLRYVN